MTVEQAKELLFELEIYFYDAVFDAMTSGADVLDLAYKNRIFKKGMNATGTKIGKYGRYYSREYDGYWPDVRSRFGLQTSFVDLKFTGDLQKSIKSEKIEADNEVVYGFDSEEEYEKAIFQEGLQGRKVGLDEMDIFSVTQVEESKTIKAIEKQIEKDLNKIIDSFA